MTRKAALASLASLTVAVCILLATACAALESRTDADQSGLESLYAAAKEEGEVFLVAIDPRDTDWISEAFGSEFPGISVRIVDELEHVPMVISDAQSPRPRLDLILTSLMEGNALDQGGYLANMDWKPFRIPRKRIGLKGRFAYTNNIAYTVAYDAKRVGKEDLPATWRDLLDPRYEGLLSTNPFVMPRIIAGLGLAWGEKEAETYALHLLDRNIENRYVDESLVFRDQNKTQRYFIGMPTTVTEQWKAAGEPAGYVIPEPVIVEQQGTAVLKTAPHPAAARLLAGWLATERARAIRHRESRTSDLLPGSSDPIAVALRKRKVRMIHDTPDTVGERTRLAATFYALFNEGGDDYNPYRRSQPTRIPIPLDDPD